MKIPPTIIVVALGLCQTISAQNEDQSLLILPEGSSPLGSDTAGPPSTPTIVAMDSSFVYLEGEKRTVPSPGICSNDYILPESAAADSDGNPRMYVDDWAELGSFIMVDDPTNQFDDPYYRIGDFQGKLRVREDGEMEYEAELGATGLFMFSYRTCMDDGGICDEANVSIAVLADPNRPLRNPGASDSSYSVTEGQRLSVSAPGFLGNDQTENSQALFCSDYASSTSAGDRAFGSSKSRSKKGNSRDEGWFSIEQDGSFEYYAPECWSGTESFSYEVCYQNFPDMCSSATTRITVDRDSNRPDPANPQMDKYNAIEGVRLNIGAPGILQNDNPNRGQKLYVYDHRRDGGFQGRLNVNADGSFEFDPEPGQLGTFRFTYETCYSDWSCVECREASVDITVAENPSKPSDPPTAVADTFEVVLGEELNVDGPGVLENDLYDTSYNIYVEDHDRGIYIERDGGIYFYGETVGETSFTYTVCYEEWRDVCATASVTIVTRPPVPIMSESRQGRATAYLVKWAGQEEHDCGELTPNLTLSCANGGYIGLLRDMTNSNSDLCTRPIVNSVNGSFPDDTILNCAPESNGMLYVECRDMQANNNTRRMLSVTMHSDAVQCREMGSTFHAIWLNTWCIGAGDTTSRIDGQLSLSYQWKHRGMNCSGTTMSDGNGDTLCYEYALGFHSEAAQPADITIASSNYESCFFNAGFGGPGRRMEATPETVVGDAPVAQKPLSDGGINLRGSH